MLSWAVFEGVSFLELIISPAHAGAQYSVARLDRDLFLFLAPLSPVLVLGILYSRWIYTGFTFAITRSRSVKSLAQRLRDSLDPLFRALGRSVSEESALVPSPKLLLFLSLSLAAFVAYFPYRSDLNPSGVPVGIDVRLYINWLTQMSNGSPIDALRYSFTGLGPSSRPLLLILLFSASSLSGLQPDLILKALPIFLALGLVASSYLLVSLGTSDHQFAALTALLTAGSSMVTVGIWASYYANWLALIEAYLFLGFLLSLMRSPSNPKRIVVISLSLTLLFTHPWTWILIMAVVGGFIASYWKSGNYRPILAFFVGLILANVAVESLKTLVLRAYGVPAAGEYLVGQTPDPFGNLLVIWPNTIDGIILTYNGLLATAIILGLAFLYALRLKHVDTFERLLLSWVLVASLPFLFLSAYFQSRIIYDMPIPILAAGGLMNVMSRFDARGPLRFLLLLVVVLLNATYAIHSMLLV
jgi:hypothetical protein